MKRFFLITLSLSLPAWGWKESFSFEELPNPEGVDPQVGAMGMMPDGRLAVAFHRGEVMCYDASKKQWAMFARGLQEPLGMLVESAQSILVMQRAELTRLRDTDGDGVADEYETVFDDFGMSGNYHEFAYGPARDAEGNLYIVLGIASNGAPMAQEIRGEFSPIGKLNREQMSDLSQWKKNSGAAGRMYARVNGRGWMIKISADGKKAEYYASGFRSPNGIGFDAKGRLLVTDNQGDWRPTSPLYAVKKDGFYGHPASLVWKPNWDGRDPLQVPVKELDAMQEKAVGYFAQGELANSPTWPVVIPESGFPAAWAGATLIGEMNQRQLVRVIDDEVDGQFQTAMVPLFDGSPLGMGNNRLAFASDGSLYVGKTALSWPGSKGLMRIRWNGQAFFSLDGVKALKDGFELTFSQPVDQASLAKLAISRHTYDYHAAYGAPKKNLEKLALQNIERSADGRRVTIKLGALREAYLHFFDLRSLRSEKGTKLLGDRAWYYVVKAPK
jgi:glucose/arabinose dehydrogenase